MSAPRVEGAETIARQWFLGSAGATVFVIEAFECRREESLTGQQKTPHPFPGAGFLESRLVLLRRALTRTSAGNEKYEDKADETERARAEDRVDPVDFEG